MKKRTVKHVLFGTVQYGLMLFYAVFLVLPVFFSFMSSIRPSEEIFKYASPFSLSTFIPRQISLESFRSLFVDYEFMKPLVNTVVVCAVTVVLGWPSMRWQGLHLQNSGSWASMCCFLWLYLP